MLKRAIFLLMILSMFTGCAEFMRNRSFVDEMENQDEDLFVANRDFPTVAGDSGMAYRSREEIKGRTPASEMEISQRAEERSIYKELRDKESVLSPYQQSLYRVAEQYLETPSEKIYFLNLSDSEKLEYLDARNFRSYRANTKVRGARELASLQPVYGKTLNMGMSKDDVINSWGRPSRVDIAGNPANQNERWAFYGNGAVRYIYFEGGRVEGWNVQ